MGIEVSRLFGCGEQNDVPECTRADIDRQLDEVYKLGVRDIELVNKFDNALGGVAGDSGAPGVLTQQREQDRDRPLLGHADLPGARTTADRTQ